MAIALQDSDWQDSAWQFRAAGDPSASARVIDGALDEIYALGQFEQARLFLDGSAGSVDRPAALLLRSRIALGRGNLNKAVRLADRATQLAENADLYGLTLLNLASVLGVGGIPDTAVQSVRRALETELSPAHRHLAAATIALWDAEHEGD